MSSAVAGLKLGKKERKREEIKRRKVGKKERIERKREGEKMFYPARSEAAQLKMQR